MKRILLQLLVLSCIIGINQLTYATSNHNTKGYTKKDGTYVKSHRATNPNHTQRDNWSSKPNSNPYTGKKGSKNPSK